MKHSLSLILIACLAIALPACAQDDDNAAGANAGADTQTTAKDKTATAIFAGGCFWCMEQAFEQVDGVASVTSGYTGGHVEDPSYKQVSHGGTGHVEAVKIVYDPAKVDYKALLDTFWHNVDPTDADGQFCDRGSSYRSEIFYTDARQKKLAQASKAALQDDSDAPSPIVTKIVPAQTFYKAEEYHQDYYRKNPLRYKLYKHACGRVDRLHALWGDAAGGHAGE